MRRILLILFILFISVNLSGQTGDEKITGKVSFISSTNIYVRFRSTLGISAGDTLYSLSNGTAIPALKVINISSVSCVCSAISSAEILIASDIIAIKRDPYNKPAEKVVEETGKIIQLKKDSVLIPLLKDPDPDAVKQKIRGSISAFSYSDFSNTSAPNLTRFRYTLSFDARNISDSKISVESYISFRHTLGDWADVRKDVFNALKVYTFSVKYDLNKTTKINLGRNINQKISSIGAMDGLQVEKTLNKFAIGALVGFRPDYTDYSFDRNLFEYGAYVGYNTKTANTYSESSLAFMQQINNSKTDRRFIYLQHSNSYIKNLYFFSSFEIDLYKLTNDLPQNTFSLTSLYTSLRYKIFKNFTLTGSYDARKNVMYYESYKTFIDRVLESEMRQSFRLQTDYRITRNLTFGLQSGYRFLKTDPKPSRNLYSYLTYNQIPGVNISATLNATYLESNYLNGKILGIRLTKDLFKGVFQTDLGYRFVDYRYPESGQNVIQNIGEMNVSLQLPYKMSFSMNYEGTFEKQSKYNRVFLQIRKRF